MNYHQNNFGNQPNVTPEQQQQQYWQQQNYQQQQQNWQFNTGQQFVPPTFSYPPQVTSFNVPPPPPKEPAPNFSVQESVLPSTSIAGPDSSQRGNFHNSGNRGKNKQPNWMKGNQKGSGGNKGGGQFSSDIQPNNQFRDAREMQQNQGSFGQNKNRKNNWNHNQNQNQSWGQPNQKRPRNNPSPSKSVNFPQHTTSVSFPQHTTAISFPQQTTAISFLQQTTSNFSNVQQPQASKSEQPAPTTSATITSQEDIEFDQQFLRWEEEFDKWKKANINHPDKNAYRQYEQQFESVRVKLLQRRNEMQKKKLDVNPPKTVEQLKFESQWKAGGSSIEENQPTPADALRPLTSTNVTMPPPPLDNSDFQNNSFDDVQHFGVEERVFRSMDFAFPTGSGIPGLDIMPDQPEPVPEPKAENNEENFIDLEIEEKLVDPKTNPPPMPKFISANNRRPVIDISSILDPPGRFQRPEKILILIRGPPGSGKSYMANLIQEKERKMGNNKCTVLSLHEFHDGSPKLKKTQEELLNEFKNILREEFFNFIVVEIDGGKLNYFHKFVHNAITLGHFKIYFIEIHQPYDICMMYNVNRRSFGEIIDTIEDIDRFQPSHKHDLLDPTSLLKPPTVENLARVPPADDSGSIGDLATNLAQLLNNKNVMDLLQSQLNPGMIGNQTGPSTAPHPKPMISSQIRPGQSRPLMTDTMIPPPHLQQIQFQPRQNQQQQNNFATFDNVGSFSSFPNPNAAVKEAFDFNYNQPPPQEPTYDNCPTFTPSKIIDYKHVHMPTLYEQLLEFKVFRVIDYKHRTSLSLREFVKDIDTDRIIEKRKSVALRKKILEYLKNAERPEDTVSNPKYPRNWEVIKRVRPPLKNKRKKKMTVKIIRVLARIDDTWMTKGYSASGNSRMDLEEISSDESMTSSSDDVECISIISKKGDFLEDPVVKIEPQMGTTPNFNRFDHKRIMDIKELLWKPDRNSRPSRISIILRGAAGSGKSHLTQLIKKKETEMGNSNLRIVSINDFFAALDEKDYDDKPDMMETFLNQMVKLVDNRMKESVCNFIIIDAENIDLKFYHQFYQTGASKGFTTYTIELYQTLNVCVAQNIHDRPSSEIKVSIENLERNRIPSDHVLLIATALYVEYDCLVNTALNKNVEAVNKMESSAENLPLSSEIFQSPSYIIPRFNWHQRSIVNIEDILEEPGRNRRSNRIMIILRGPSGAGKTYLAGLILAKEVEKGNAGGVINISIDDYFIDPFTLSFKYDRFKVEKNIEGMLQNLTSIIGNRAHNFIIIDAENDDISVYERFYKAGTSGGFKCYAIELFQDAEACVKNNVHNRSIEDIERVLDKMKKDLIPADHVLLNPMYLYGDEASSTSLKIPLKSALKPSEGLTPFLGLNRLPKSVKPQTNHQEEFRSRLKQPIMVNGEFVIRNFNPPKLPEFNWHNRDIVDIREILEEPGRSTRPEKIAIVLRGVPGSGKTYLAYLIERKEAEKGNRSQFKFLTMDEYFETEHTREIVDENGDKRTETYRKYDYDPSKLNIYMENLIEKLQNITRQGEHKFIVIEGDFCDMFFYERIFAIALTNGFSGYTIEVNQDSDICKEYNDHRRYDEINKKQEFMSSIPTPDNHILLDPEYLYEEYSYSFADESEKTVKVSGKESDEDLESDEAMEASFGPLKKAQITSKWDDDDDAADLVIERLDGIKSKPVEGLTMAAYLKTDDEWTMRPSTSGKKRVRWADIEEKKEQEKMRKIGFIVGQTDWKRMTDTTDGKSALEKTKYIEPREK